MPTLLIIDDNAVIAHVLATFFRRHGYTVATAADGPAGAQQIANLQPDMVICDIDLPVVLGPQLIEDCLPITTPVLFVSGNGNVTVEVNGRVLPVIAKPFELQGMLAQVTAAFAAHRHDSVHVVTTA